MLKHTSHALYIHWPFCKKKCPYCDFNSHVRDYVDVNEWHNAMIAELRWYHSLAAKLPVSSIFFGGGTPSLMPPSIASALIDEAQKLFGFCEDIEITLEANPTSTENSKLSDLRKAGVNRLSLGIQSLNSNALKFLEREHSINEALEALDIASNIFSRYSFDLIYALPEQTIKGWEEELAKALEYAGEHLSLYQLTIEQGTQFFHHHKAGKIIMPEEKLCAEFYEITQEIMNDNNMPAYEISNHAKYDEQAKYNTHVWIGGSYIGIGAGAHGRMLAEENKCYATSNLRSPEKWLKQVQDRNNANEIMQEVSDNERLEENIMMGLRLTEGLKIDTAKHWNSNYLEALKNEGIIDYNANKIASTIKGRLILNQLISGLLENIEA